MSSLLTLPSFTEVFPEIDTTKSGAATSATSSESTLQGLTIGLYESESVRTEPLLMTKSNVRIQSAA